MRARRAHMEWLGAIPKQPRKGRHFLRKFRVANNGEKPTLYLPKNTHAY